jgi:hypothetical protein
MGLLYLYDSLRLFLLEFSLNNMSEFLRYTPDLGRARSHG